MWTSFLYTICLLGMENTPNNFLCFEYTCLFCCPKLPSQSVSSCFGVGLTYLDIKWWQALQIFHHRIGKDTNLSEVSVLELERAVPGSDQSANALRSVIILSYLTHKHIHIQLCQWAATLADILLHDISVVPGGCRALQTQIHLQRTPHVCPFDGHQICHQWLGGLGASQLSYGQYWREMQNGRIYTTIA